MALRCCGVRSSRQLFVALCGVPRMPRSMATAIPHSADVVIIGAGLSGIACAYHLALQHRHTSSHTRQNVLLIDARPAMSLTSAVSTECYRNFWPANPSMVALTNHSIDLMEQVARHPAASMRLNQRGYLYVSSDGQQQVSDIVTAIEQVAPLAAATHLQCMGVLIRSADWCALVMCRPSAMALVQCDCTIPSSQVVAIVPAEQPLASM
jgi:glycine/D-amino acid oxidase-like deaminating enzyme